MSAQQFQYTPTPPFSGGMPLLDMMLSHGDHALQVSALVDSGASLNLLPYDIGLHLGFRWEDQRLPIPTGGLLRGAEAYAVLVHCHIDSFPPLDLAFAWTHKPSHEVRVLLGQVNFFQHFDVHFYGSQHFFKIASVEK